MNEMHERPVVTEANKEAVRQGSTGHHVRYVLIISCALVVIAFIAVTLFIKPRAPPGALGWVLRM